MDKVVVYAGTRNVYEQMYVSLKSLLLNNEIDRVYLMIEDEQFPYPIPNNVIPVDVSKQEFFKPGTPNINSPWSYMDLLRVCLAGIFQDEKKMLWLDIDTIINDDITDLFEMNMDGYFYAGVMEPKKSNGVFQYINSGVLMCNLDHLRMWQKEIEMIAFLNYYPLTWPGQDVINIFCQGRIKLFSSDYNYNAFSIHTNTPKIYHFAAVKPEDYMKDWAYKKYEQVELPLVEVKDDEQD